MKTFLRYNRTQVMDGTFLFTYEFACKDFSDYFFVLNLTR